MSKTPEPSKGHARGIFVHTAGPNTALVKSSGRKDVRIVIGGRMWALPILERVDYLSLALRTITVHTTAGLTIKGVPVDVTSACQVKIQGWSSSDDASANHDRQKSSAIVSHDLHMDYSAIRLAAQHFIGKSDVAIEDAIQKTIAGHQRAIIGCLTVEELYRDREAFCKRVLDLVSADMRNMGLTVVSYTVAEILDSNGYIDALGVTQRERLDRDASEGRALHQAEAKKHRAAQDAAAHLEVNDQQRRKIESDRELKVIDLRAQEEIERKTAIQKKAHAISSAEQDKILFVAEQRAAAAATEAELDVVRQQVQRERLVKEKLVHVEADAMLYKAKVNADGIRASAAAEAERVRVIGEAQAGAIRAKGLAEVEVLRERNRAWQESANSGAILEKIIQVLPEMARAIAQPLSKTEKMVFVGGGGRGGGPSQFTEEMNRLIAQVPESVSAITGIDLRQALASFGASHTGDAVVQGAAEGAATAFMQARPRNSSTF